MRGQRFWLAPACPSRFTLTFTFGVHKPARSDISFTGSLAICIEDKDLSRQAEALYWQCWKLATDPDPNNWELVTLLGFPFVP